MFCRQYKRLTTTMSRECLTCSSSEREAARAVDAERPSRAVLLNEALLVVGLSGGDSEVLGVVLMSAFEGYSDSFSNLSKIGARVSLSGKSDMAAECRGTSIGSVYRCF